MLSPSATLGQKQTEQRCQKKYEISIMQEVFDLVHLPIFQYQLNYTLSDLKSRMSALYNKMSRFEPNPC